MIGGREEGAEMRVLVGRRRVEREKLGERELL